MRIWIEVAVLLVASLGVWYGTYWWYKNALEAERSAYRDSSDSWRDLFDKDHKLVEEAKKIRDQVRKQTTADRYLGAFIDIQQARLDIATIEEAAVLLLDKQEKE